MNVVTGTVAPEVIPERAITRLAFRNRFTQSEKVAIEIACLDNPAASMQVRGAAAALRASQADLQASRFIDLDRADLIAGVEQLELYEVIADGRAQEIIFGEIEDIERFTG